MRSTHPYEPTIEVVSQNRSFDRKRSLAKRAFVGALLGASTPALLSAYGLYQFSVYASSLPPGTPLCGNAALGSMMLLVFVAPLLALVGAAIGCILP